MALAEGSDILFALKMLCCFFVFVDFSRRISAQICRSLERLYIKNKIKGSSLLLTPDIIQEVKLKF